MHHGVPGLPNSFYYDTTVSVSLRLNSFHPARDPLIEALAHLVIVVLNKLGQIWTLRCIVPIYKM
jgi:hypothetical protein